MLGDATTQHWTSRRCASLERVARSDDGQQHALRAAEQSRRLFERGQIGGRMGLELAALLIAGLFVASGLGHIHEHAGFVATLRAYRLMPAAVAPWAAAAVIVVEIGAASLIVVAGTVAQAGLVMLAGIAAVGAILITFDLVVGNRSHACGCLGGGHGSLSWWLPLRSAVIAACAAAVAMLGPSSATLAPVVAAFL